MINKHHLVFVVIVLYFLFFIKPLNKIARIIFQAI